MSLCDWSATGQETVLPEENTISFERGPRSERGPGSARARVKGSKLKLACARADPGPHSPRGPLSREILLETRLFVSFFWIKETVLPRTMKRPASLMAAPAPMCRPAAAAMLPSPSDQSTVALLELERFFPKGELKNAQGQTYTEYCRELRHEWVVEKDRNETFPMVNAAGEFLAFELSFFIS